MAEFDPNRYWESTLGKHFDLQGVGYGSLGARYNEWLYRLRKVIFRRVLARAGVKARQVDVLDIGSGTGFYIDLWLRAGARSVTGVDLTEVSVRVLGDRFPQARFVQADAGDSLDALGGQFDVVDAFDVLFHIVDDERYANAFRNIAMVCKPGGTLLFSDNFLHGETTRAAHQVCRGLPEIEIIVREAGFEIVDRVPMFIWMNQPVDTQSALTKSLWSRTIPFAGRAEWLGWLMGAALYPVDRVLTRVMRESPTTEVMICRRKV